MNGRITRRTLLTILVAAPLVRHVDHVAEAAPDDVAVWDFEITDCSWRDKDEVMVSALQRGSIGDTRYDAEGDGHWYFAWPTVERLTALGPFGLCEDLLYSEWLEDGRVGTISISAGLV